MSIIVPIFVPTMGSGQLPVILFSQTTFDVLSSAGTVAGNARIGGKYSGTPSWSLTNNSSGVYAISATTGQLTILSTTNLAAQTETITIAVSGLTPASTAKTFTIVVNSSAAPVTITGQYFWLGF